MINKEVTDQESAPNNADTTSNENGDTIINRECAVGPSDVGFDGPSLKTSSRVSIITKYEEAVLKNRRDDADNDVSTLANSFSSSALGELLYCRTALSGASASAPFHPEAQHRPINSSVKKGTLFYVNSCYPGEISQLPSTWNSLSSSAEPKSKSVEDKEGEDRKTLEETKGLSGNEEIPDTIPYIPVPSIIVPQEGRLYFIHYCISFLGSIMY